MRSYVLLAAATGALATNGFQASGSFDFNLLPAGCNAGLIETLIHDVLPFFPEFCPKISAGMSAEALGANMLAGTASLEITNACKNCIPHVTGSLSVPTAPATATSSAVATSAASSAAITGTTTSAFSEVSSGSVASTSSSSLSAPTTTAKGPGSPQVSSSSEAQSTVAPQTSVRKCRGPKPTHEVSSAPVSSSAPSSSAVESSSAPVTTSEPAKATPTGAVGSSSSSSAEPSKAHPTGAVGSSTTAPAKSTPTGATSSSCPAPKISGGDFGILGEISNIAGMALTSLSGQCGAKVFGSGSAGGAGAFASFGIGRRTGALLSSLGVSGSLKGIFGGGNFLQITGNSANAKQQLCHKVPVCKGQTYKLHVDAGCDKSGASMGFSVGGNVLASALTSPVKTLTGDMSATASMDWEFTWNGETGMEVDCCLLTNIEQELGSIGLSGWTMGFSGQAGVSL